VLRKLASRILDPVAARLRVRFAIDATQERLARIEAMRDHWALIEPAQERLARIEAMRDHWAMIEPTQERLARIEAILFEHAEARAVSASAHPHPFGSPAVTVVMPTWNRAALVGAAIRSVQAQHFADWELIVVDDGSADRTDQVVRGFAADARIRYVRTEHVGMSAARNIALAQARGAILAYLDSDNVWYPGFLAAAVGTFAAEPEVDCLYGALVTDDAFGPGRLLFEPFDRARLERSNYIDTNVFMHRRVLIERHGDFDLALNRLDDWDLVLRYTADKPPYRLPVLAARYRMMDSIRVTETQPIAPAEAHIRRKLALAPAPSAEPG